MLMIYYEQFFLLFVVSSFLVDDHKIRRFFVQRTKEKGKNDLILFDTLLTIKLTLLILNLSVILSKLSLPANENRRYLHDLCVNILID